MRLYENLFVGKVLSSGPLFFATTGRDREQMSIAETPSVRATRNLGHKG